MERRELLAVNELRTEFVGPRATVAVRDATFNIAEGEVLGLVGESGSGKSVLVKSLIRILPANGRITQGRVLWCGEDLRTASEGRMVEEHKAMLVGADNFGLEHFPSNDPAHLAPVHEYLLVERGVSLLEVLWLEDLARDQVYEVLFIASSLKLRGATASPIRPIAIPLRRDE